MSLKNDLETLRKDAERDFSRVENLKDWNAFRVRYLGKKSPTQAFLRSLGQLPRDQRPEAGQVINVCRQEIKNICQKAKHRLEEKKWDRLEREDDLDVTEPAFRRRKGGRHPIHQVEEEVVSIFLSMGFSWLDGPEVETEFNNFEALNIPPDHPARDMQDTFWLKNGNVLRTHTSNVQIRALKNLPLPLKAISPGRVYRNEELDAGHEHSFHQVECLYVDREVSVSHLIAVIRVFLRRLFEKDVEVRLRPGYFPFVEPGFEVDFSCLICEGQGCRACKQVGWLEFMGAGLVHPNVFKACDIDATKWTGFAFGFGLDRLTMMRYGIDDIRHFHGKDFRFLEQFR
jgi:phenylalanyl-tRNA synthetase alpha chain